MAKANKAIKKATRESGAEEVQSFIRNIDHPLQKAMAKVREIILASEKGITEHIKWNAPSFCFQSDDRITFNIHRDGTLLLVFHRGAKAKDNKARKQLFEDRSGLLEWLATDRAVLRFTSLEDVNAKKTDLKDIVSKWLKATAV